MSGTRSQVRAAKEPLTFLSLPPELRLEMYEHLLVCKSPIRVQRRIGDRTKWNNITREEKHPARNAKYGLSPNILLANKFIFEEASSILYGLNLFDLVEGIPAKLRQRADIKMYAINFLNEIGDRNASYIRHIRMDFPRFHIRPPRSSFDDPIYRLVLKNESQEFLKYMKDTMKNLRTITITSASSCEMEDTWSRSPQAWGSGPFEWVFRQYDCLFECFPKLEKRNVEVYHINSTSYSDNRLDHVREIRKTMESYGWTLVQVWPAFNLLGLPSGF